jgi:hypothetical protein
MGVLQFNHSKSVKIILHFNDRTTRPAEITGTELTAPTVISVKGKYFLKIPYSPLTVAEVNGIPEAIPYFQCRGAELSSIEIVRSQSSEEVA